jgi:fructose-1,6-bisphosphatase/inositol monophosphatase family enzyme
MVPMPPEPALPTGFAHAEPLKVMLRAALEAGGMLLRMRHGPNASWRKADSSLVSEADHAAAALVDQALHRAFPQAALLNEETYLHHRAAEGWQSASLCFMVDPLDSTNSFVHGHPHYGVIVALCEDGAPVAGVTYKPELGELYLAAKGAGAFRTFAGPENLDSPPDAGAWQRIKVTSESRLSLVTSHGRVTPGLNALLHKLGQPESRRMNGSLKINEVARGEFNAFVSPTENAMSLWDIAAPHIILSESGGLLTDLGGEPIDWRPAEPVLHRGLLASNGTVHTTILERLRR